MSLLGKIADTIEGFAGVLGATQTLEWTGLTKLSAPADGHLKIANNAGTVSLTVAPDGAGNQIRSGTLKIRNAAGTQSAALDCLANGAYTTGNVLTAGIAATLTGIGLYTGNAQHLRLGVGTQIAWTTDTYGHLGTVTATEHVGTGSPEGAVAANPGSTYRNLSGGAGTTFYVKESLTGNTGWIAK